MKDTIKQILRENLHTNMLGISVTRPNQELILMVGVSGSGKSTMAKSILREGRIHSTDEVIERTGDYNDFFRQLFETGDYSSLSRMHSQNLREAIASMKEGSTQVIIDNTNLTKSDMKPYVMAALNMGFADENIKINMVGTAGLSAEQLAERNAHGVPLDKIKQMIKRYNSLGRVTLESIIKAPDKYKKSDILYSAVVLKQASKNKLIEVFGDKIPSGWKTYCHHMTITFGKGVSDKNELGKDVTLSVNALGKSDMAMAVRVSGYPSSNAIPHITLAVNPDGGSPKESNNITKWEDIKPFNVIGVVSEIKK